MSMQLSLGMDMPVAVGRVTKASSADATFAAIDFISSAIPTSRPRGQRGQRPNSARPVAYLYARQNDEADERISITRQHDELRYVEARGEAADGEVIVADWLRVTGERSTRRTETYGDTRARWKVADHWTRNRTDPEKPVKPWRWALDLRVAAGWRGDVADAIERVRSNMTAAAIALPSGCCTVRTNTLLATDIAPIVVAAAWAEWMPTAIALAYEVDPTGDTWAVEADRLALQGQPHHEALARSTVDPNLADHVIIRALQWVHEVS